MKKAFAFLLLGSSAAVMADQPNLKVCVYDPDRVMGQSKEWTEAVTSLDKSYQKKFDDMKKEEESLKDAMGKFQTKMSMLSESSRETEQDSLMRRKRDLEGRAERVMEDYKMERQKTGMKFLKKLEEGVGGFAQANNYDLVLPKGPGVYALARADQTAAIVGHMNKKFDEGHKSVVAAAKGLKEESQKTA